MSDIDPVSGKPVSQLEYGEWKYSQTHTNIPSEPKYRYTTVWRTRDVYQLEHGTKRKLYTQREQYGERKREMTGEARRAAVERYEYKAAQEAVVAYEKAADPGLSLEERHDWAREAKFKASIGKDYLTEGKPGESADDKVVPITDPTLLKEERHWRYYQEVPERFKKQVTIPGDVKQLGLGERYLQESYAVSMGYKPEQQATQEWKKTYEQAYYEKYPQPEPVVYKSTVFEKEQEAIRQRWSGERGIGEQILEGVRFWASGLTSPENILYHKTIAEVAFEPGFSFLGLPSLTKKDKEAQQERILGDYTSSIMDLETARKKGEGFFGETFEVFKKSYELGGFGFTGTVVAVMPGAFKGLGLLKGTGGAILSKGVPVAVMGGMSTIAGVDIGYTAAMEEKGLLPEKSGLKKVFGYGTHLAVGIGVSSIVSKGPMKILPGKKEIGIYEAKGYGWTQRYADVFGKQIKIAPKHYYPLKTGYGPSVQYPYAQQQFIGTTHGAMIPYKPFVSYRPVGPAITSFSQIAGNQRIIYNPATGKFVTERITTPGMKPLDIVFKPPVHKPKPIEDILFKPVTFDLVKQMGIKPVQKPLEYFVRGSFLIEPKGVFNLEKIINLKGMKPFETKDKIPIKFKKYMDLDITDIKNAEKIRQNIIKDLSFKTGLNKIEPHVKTAVKRLNELGYYTDQSGFLPYDPTKSFISFRTKMTPKIEQIAKQLGFKIIPTPKGAITFAKFHLEISGKTLTEIKQKFDTLTKELYPPMKKYKPFKVTKEEIKTWDKQQEDAFEKLRVWKPFTLQELIRPDPKQAKLFEKIIPSMKPLDTEFKPPVHKPMTIEDMYKKMSADAKASFLRRGEVLKLTKQTRLDTLFKFDAEHIKFVITTPQIKTPFKFPKPKTIIEKPSSFGKTILVEPTAAAAEQVSTPGVTKEYDPYGEILQKGYRGVRFYEEDQYISSRWSDVFKQPSKQDIGQSLFVSPTKKYDISSASRSKQDMLQLQTDLQKQLQLQEQKQLQLQKMDLGSKLITTTISRVDVGLEQVQLQSQSQLLKQELQLVTIPWMDIKPPPPPKKIERPRPRFGFLLPMLGIDKTITEEPDQGYNVFVKSRQYYQGKPRGAEKFRKLTNKSFSYNDAKSLLGSALDHSIAQTGYIKPSGKPAKKLHKNIPSRWDSISYKFSRKNGKWQEQRAYAIDQPGESQELNVFQWHRRLPKKKTAKKSEVVEYPTISMDMYNFDKLKDRFDKMSRRYRL